VRQLLRAAGRAGAVTELRSASSPLRVVSGVRVWYGMCIAADELSQCDAVSVAFRCDWERHAVEPKKPGDAILQVLVLSAVMIGFEES
jgi:hypothetical protein